MRIIAFLLSLILIFMIPCENAIFIKGIGTVSKAAGILVAGFWILSVVATGQHRKIQRFHILILLYFFWQILSYFWSINEVNTLDRIITNFQLIIMIIIFWDLYTTPAELKAGLQAYVLGAYVSIANIVTNYLSVSENIHRILRYNASGFGPNDLALILALGIPVAWHLAISKENDKQNRMLKLANFAYVPAAVFSIILTGSRGGFIAMCFSFIFIGWSTIRLGFIQRTLIIAALIGIVFLLQPLVPVWSVERLSTIGRTFSERNLGRREVIWRKGWLIFKEHPINGIGSNAYSNIYKIGNIGMVAHNSFLSVLVENGIVGFSLFIIILAITVYHAIHQPVAYSRLWISILSVWAVGAMALSWEHRKQTWLFMGLVIISAEVFNHKKKSEHLGLDLIN